MTLIKTSIILIDSRGCEDQNRHNIEVNNSYPIRIVGKYVVYKISDL